EVVALGVADEEIATAEPAVAELRFSLARQVGVTASLCRMPDPQHARLAGGGRTAARVAQIDLHTCERRAGAHSIRGAGWRHHAGAEGSRHAVQIEQLAAERPPPLLYQLSRKALAGGDEATHRRERREALWRLREKAPED